VSPSGDESARQEDAARRFDQWAERYEEDSVSRWLAALQDHGLEALDLRTDDQFLDVGCGTGRAVRRAAFVVQRAAGVDLSPAMVVRARELAASLPNVEFEEADASHLPFASGEFTAILCSTSFHHYPDPQGAVDEMARTLAPGGRLVIADGSADRFLSRLADRLIWLLQPSHVRFYTSREMADFFYEAGLRDVQLRSIWGGGYAFIRGRKPR
jgi:ubiquinone/menaquinone biosynthesis C-methylase UbiE